MSADVPTLEVRSLQTRFHTRDGVLPVVDELPHYAKKPAAFGGEDTLAEW